MGSVLAIGLSVGLAGYQARKQHATTMAAIEAQDWHRRRQAAEALRAIAGNTSKLVGSIASKLNTREAIYLVAAEQGLPFDLPELAALNRSLGSIPLHELPESLITHAMVVASTARQFELKVLSALQHYRSMDGAAHEDFFSTVTQMRFRLRETFEMLDAWLGAAGNTDTR